MAIYSLLLWQRNCDFTLCWPLLIAKDSYVVMWTQVLTTGALHQIDFTSIRSAAAAWHDEFAHVPRPLLVVNIGGPSSNFQFFEFNFLKCSKTWRKRIKLQWPFFFLVIWLISIIDLGNCRYGVDLAKQLVASLLSVLASCGSVRISFTEKTPQKVWSTLKSLKILSPTNTFNCLLLTFSSFSVVF
jgi:mitochondrial fission protein ELM1